MCVCVFFVFIPFFCSQFFILYVNVINPLIKKKLNTKEKTKQEKNMFFPGFSCHFPSICHPFFEQISMSVKLAMVDVRMFA